MGHVTSWAEPQTDETYRSLGFRRQLFSTERQDKLRREKQTMRTFMCRSKARGCPSHHKRWCVNRELFTKRVHRHFKRELNYQLQEQIVIRTASRWQKVRSTSVRPIAREVQHGICSWLYHSSPGESENCKYNRTMQTNGKQMLLDFSIAADTEGILKKFLTILPIPPAPLSSPFLLLFFCFFSFLLFLAFHPT